MNEILQMKKAVLTKSQFIQLFILIIIWLVAIGIYWWWWLSPSHFTSFPLLFLNTCLFFYITGLPAYSFFFALRMRTWSFAALDPTVRVAMVVTKAPSEPWDMVQKTLQAMLKQDGSHHSWLADEKPTQQVIDWCRKNNVYLSSRDGVEEYHNNTWPRRRACKEGNLSYFYDKYGYDNYDIVVQLDADHVPQPGYLKSIIAPFADPTIGYVAAPSICDRNQVSSWSTRGRLFFESFLHGPLQMGYCSGWQPICIGSHYAVRTNALKQIGGLGPELAEDLSTSLMMISAGWHGAFSENAYCSGLGPSSFQDCMTQEFQWSKSITLILLRYSYKWLKSLPWYLQFQLFYVQLFYPIRGLQSLSAIGMGFFALITAQAWINLNFLVFVQLNLLLYVITLLPCLYLKSLGYLRPSTIRIPSWETWLFEMARGPWIFLGSLSAVFEYFSSRSNIFHVTNKHNFPQPVPVRFLSPYLVLVLIGGISTLIFKDVGPANGYFLLILLACSVFTFVCLFVVILGALESSEPLLYSIPAFLTSILLIIFLLSCWWIKRNDIYSVLFVS